MKSISCKKNLYQKHNFSRNYSKETTKKDQFIRNKLTVKCHWFCAVDVDVLASCPLNRFKLLFLNQFYYFDFLYFLFEYYYFRCIILIRSIQRNHECSVQLCLFFRVRNCPVGPLLISSYFLVGKHLPKCPSWFKWAPFLYFFYH